MKKHDYINNIIKLYFKDDEKSNLYNKVESMIDDMFLMGEFTIPSVRHNGKDVNEWEDEIENYNNIFVQDIKKSI